MTQIPASGVKWIGLCLLASIALPSSGLAQSAGLGAAGELVDPDILRVCADPSNMPFSDESGQGFENKLAELVAAKTGRKSVAYTWYPMATGFVRNTLGANLCDIVIGYAQGDELVQNTNAYYKSTYAVVYKKGAGLDGLDRLTDPRLADRKIGIVESTPPSTILAKAGLMRHVHPYPLMVDTRLQKSMAEVMLTIFGMVGMMEKHFIKARQRRGIEAAKLKGVYKGRPVSISPDAVQELRAEGLGATEIAKRLKIGRASVYRALAA